VIDGLPPGWTVTTLGAVGRWGSGGTPKTSDRSYYGGAIPWAKSGDLNDGQLFETEDKITEAGLANSAAKLLEPGTLLIALYGATIGRVAVNQISCATNQAVAHCAPHADLTSTDYLFWFTLASRAELRELGQGGAQPNISQAILKAFPIPLPPLREQRRIVARIEALFARTRRARADLERIAPLAKRYRERVLAKAFDTEAPRVRIDAVAELAAGYAFPKEWQGKTRGDYPFAKVRDISLAVAEADGVLDRANNYLDAADLTSLRARPVPAGATVFAKIGEGLRLNRRAITSRSLIIDNNCMALVPKARAVHATYLHRFMLTVDLSPLAVATSVPSVRASDIAALEIPVPTSDEQAAAVRTIDKAQGAAKTVEREAVRALALLDRLEQSILTRAFRGELALQDPNDEPASLLLERNQAEGEAEGEKSTKGLRRKPNRSKEQLMMDKPLPPRERLLKDSEKWPTTGLPFEAIAKRNSMPHDTLRDALFELLSGPSPALQQRFDGDSEIMVIQRVAA